MPGWRSAGMLVEFGVCFEITYKLIASAEDASERARCVRFCESTKLRKVCLSRRRICGAHLDELKFADSGQVRVRWYQCHFEI